MEKTVMLEAVKRTKRYVVYEPAVSKGEGSSLFAGNLYIAQWALPDGRSPKLEVTIKVVEEGS